MAIIKKKGAPLSSLHDLMVVKLQKLYDIEKELVKALPKMAKKASSEDLQKAFEEHLEQTVEHVARLEKVFDLLGEKNKSKKSNALRGLIEDANELSKIKGEPSVLDAGSIAAGQCVEHLEIAEYGTAITWAQLMEHNEVVSILEETLTEEKETDEKLTTLAEGIINTEALEMGEEDTEEDASEDIGE